MTKDPNDNVIDASAVFSATPSAAGEAADQPTVEDEEGTPNIRALAADESTRDPTVAEQLVAIAADAELFHVDQIGYASVIVDGRRETWRIGSKGMSKYLSHAYYTRAKKVPGAQALADALRTLDGKAVFAGEERQVYVRVAHCGAVTYLDLADAERRIVRIDRDGWAITTDAPVRFVRPRGLMPLPTPVRGGSLDELRPFLNVRKLPLWRLVLAWLVSAFFPGPYTFLVLLGQQGTAKTSTSRNLRFVADPNRSSVRAQPRSVRDLVIGAANSIFLVLDNVSYIDEWLSDALCRMSTGGGFSTRELFTDQDEIIIDVQRPGILNGITDIVSRGDLLDRSILVELPLIPPDERRTQAEMEKDFEAAWPRILGALLDAVSGVIRHVDEVELEELPRMADFARLGVALERALGWPAHSFIDAYTDAISAAHDVALDVSVIAPYLRRIAERGFEGTASDLLSALNEAFDGRFSARADPGTSLRPRPKPKGWPMSPGILSGQLRRLAPNLDAAGITIGFSQTQGAGSRKLISIRRSGAQARTTVSSACASPAVPPPALPMAPPAMSLPVPSTTVVPPVTVSTATPMPWEMGEANARPPHRGHPPRLYTQPIFSAPPPHALDGAAAEVCDADCVDEEDGHGGDEHEDGGAV